MTAFLTQKSCFLLIKIYGYGWVRTRAVECNPFDPFLTYPQPGCTDPVVNGASTVEECKAACEAEPQCGLFIFSKNSFSWCNDARGCYLRGMPGRTFDTCADLDAMECTDTFNDNEAYDAYLIHRGSALVASSFSSSFAQTRAQNQI